MPDKYMFSGSLVAEAASLQYQHRLFFEEMHALLPESIPLAQLKHMLDAKCGPGAWAIDMARTHPDMEITGMDVDINMTRMATENALSSKIHNVTFDVGDIRKELPYNANYFDYIRVLMGSELASPQMWPDIIRELLRVLRPGGWLNLIEYEAGPMSSPSLDSLSPLLYQAVVKAQWTISPEGMAPTSGLILPRLLREAGCVGVDYTLHSVSLGGWDNGAGRAYVMTSLAHGNRVVPFLLNTGMISQPAMKTLLEKMEPEVEQTDFCGTGMLISALGRKPETRETKTREE